MLEPFIKSRPMVFWCLFILYMTQIYTGRAHTTAWNRVRYKKKCLWERSTKKKKIIVKTHILFDGPLKHNEYIWTHFIGTRSTLRVLNELDTCRLKPFKYFPGLSAKNFNLSPLLTWIFVYPNKYIFGNLCAIHELLFKWFCVLLFFLHVGCL